MIRISVKTDRISNRKIKLFPEEGGLFRLELDRLVVKRPGQSKSLFTPDEVLELVADLLEWTQWPQNGPTPPRRLPAKTRVVVKVFDDEGMPRRRKTWTTTEPFLNWRGVWQVFVLGERKPVALDYVEVDL